MWQDFKDIYRQRPAFLVKWLAQPLFRVAYFGQMRSEGWDIDEVYRDLVDTQQHLSELVGNENKRRAQLPPEVE